MSSVATNSPPPGAIPDPFYSTPEWVDLRERARARDDHSCTVARLLGGTCRGILHGHHIVPRSERPDLELDLENVGTVCAAHHRRWESIRLFLVRSRRELPPCRHHHPYREGRLACDRRRARALGISLEQETVAA